MPEIITQKSVLGVEAFWRAAMVKGLEHCESREDLFETLKGLAAEMLGITSFDEFDAILNEYIRSSSDIIDVRDIEDPAIAAADTNTYAAKTYQTTHVGR